MMRLFCFEIIILDKSIKRKLETAISTKISWTSVGWTYCDYSGRTGFRLEDKRLGQSSSSQSFEANPTLAARSDAAKSSTPTGNGPY